MAGAALSLAIGTAAQAADYIPPVVEAPQIEYRDVSYGGWYIRGDIDYHHTKFRGADYVTYGCPATTCTPAVPPGTNSFTDGSFRGALSLGGGIGYQINKYLRADVTGDYWFKSNFTGTTAGASCGTPPVPCNSIDESSYRAFVLLANAYAELGTWHKVTPYVGAGIGGAYVEWANLRNTIPGVTVDEHRGESEFRFAWALMAGASYCLTNNLKADLGYRYTNIAGGRMFSQYAPDGTFLGVGPGRDRGFHAHEVRAGLRYHFGGDNGCGSYEMAYQPEPAVYK
jgi:opacity protein-like surface antigen